MINQLFVLLLLVIPPNKIETDNLNQSTLIGLVQDGISITQFKQAIKQGEFLREPLSNYGVDSEKFGWTHINNGEKTFFIWAKQDSQLIEEIIILNSSLSIDNITVGNTLKDFLKNNPNARIEIDVIDSKYEYAFSPGKGYTVEFLSHDGRIAEYDDNSALKRIKNPDAFIDRIRVKRRN